MSQDTSSIQKILFTGACIAAASIGAIFVIPELYREHVKRQESKKTGTVICTDIEPDDLIFLLLLADLYDKWNKDKNTNVNIVAKRLFNNGYPHIMFIVGESQAKFKI